MDGMVGKRHKRDIILRVTGLDGKEYIWNPTNGRMVTKESSSYHNIARKVIKSIYTCDPLLEEVSLSGTKPVLYADFVIPLRRLLIEVHGEQHYNWIPHFHSTKRDFLMAKKRDLKKLEWSKINDFRYIELPHWESENEWRERIISEED